MTNTLKIDNYEIQLDPIQSTDQITLDTKDGEELNINEKGETLTKICKQKSVYIWINNKTQKEEKKTYKCFKGQPVRPLEKTVEVKEYHEIPLKDMDYYTNNEKTYLVSNEDFKKHIINLNKKKKVLTFKYTNGKGFKTHTAIITYNTLVKKTLMQLYQTDLRKTKLEEVKENQEVKRMELK